MAVNVCVTDAPDVGFHSSPVGVPVRLIVTIGASVTHTFTAKPSGKAYTQRTGLALGAKEQVYSLVNIGVTITPSTTDVLTIDGVEWSVLEVIPMDSAGYVISWLVKVYK